MLSAAPVFAEQDAVQAVLEKFEETVTPVYSAAQAIPAAPGKKKDKKGKFYSKLQKERREFYEEERERKNKFLEKIRNDQSLSDEERQQKLMKFFSKEGERRRKFMEKTNKKILKNSQQES